MIISIYYFILITSLVHLFICTVQHVYLFLSADPPRHTSVVALSDLMEPYEGFPSLRCSSDANPKVENYTWFKVNVAPPVGSGQNYSTKESGWYYCMAWNRLGMQRSAPLHITRKSQCLCVWLMFSFIHSFILCLNIYHSFIRSLCVAITVCSFSLHCKFMLSEQLDHPWVQ